MNYTQAWLFMTHRSEPLRQTSLLMLLAGGIGHGETLVHGLKTHALESSGSWASKVGQLRLLMEQGHALSASLAMVGDLLPDQTISAIRTGESTGTLADVLVDEAQRISRTVGASGNGLSLEVLALFMFCIVTAMVSITTFIMIYIIPKFKEIFIGFGVVLPEPTVRLIRAADWFMSFGFLLFLPIFGSCLFGFWWMYSSSAKKLIHGYHRLMEHWPRYWVPGLLRQLSLSAATGQPLGTALTSALMDMPPGRASRKVSELQYRITAGEEVISTLESMRFLRSREAAFLQSSLKTRHLDWGLRHLADAIEQKRQRWVKRIPALMAPAIILSVGFVVLLIALGLFTPLVKLLNDIS